MAKSRKQKRLERKAKAETEAKALRTSKEARFDLVNAMGQSIISNKWQLGLGKSRNAGKAEGDIYKYITSKKARRDISANWQRFARFVAEHSNGNDLDSLDSLKKYVDRYIQSCVDRDLSAWTLTTYKSHLGKVFDLPTTAFLATKPRLRAEAKRSRRDTESDKHISKEKRDFFKVLGSATGLRKKELMALKGTDLAPERDSDGFFYLTIKGKGGLVRKSPILASSKDEEEYLLKLIRQTGSNFVCDDRVYDLKTYRVPVKLDEHSYRAIYAARVYNHYERPLDRIPRDQKTFLRKELRGHVLDKYAEKMTSQALGHRRIDEFRKSYAYQLVK